MFAANQIKRKMTFATGMTVKKVCLEGAIIAVTTLVACFTVVSFEAIQTIEAAINTLAIQATLREIRVNNQIAVF